MTSLFPPLLTASPIVGAESPLLMSALLRDELRPRYDRRQHRNARLTTFIRSALAHMSASAKAISYKLFGLECRHCDRDCRRIASCPDGEPWNMEQCYHVSNIVME